MSYVIFIFLIFTACSTNFILKKECSNKQAFIAEDKISSINSWKSLYSFYKKFGSCDDGSIGEGVSDVVTKILANKWDKLKELKDIIVKDRIFEKFVIKHIDESVAFENLRTIENNLKFDCKRSLTSICKKIKIQLYTLNY